MNKMIYKLVVILLLGITTEVNADLVLGFSRPDNLNIFRSIKSRFGYRPFSLVEVGTGSMYWGISRDGKGIAKYNLSGEGEVLGWPLTRWPQELQNKKIASMYELGSDPEFAKEYAYKPANSNPIGKQPAVMGCLAQHPLRYGDLNEDGKDELVLFLGYESQVLDIVMFNPEKEKIQFSARTIFTDVSDGYALSDRFKYQYSSQFNLNKGHYVGTKTYAKVFMGEFDGNESSPDIIVWRKHYTSLSKNTSTKGFKLASQNYQFYTLKEGEYQLQISLEAQIENWMSEYELTWSKGYPSKSECAGQEGQLIPEMHDPLLNDPDVLK
ncbi:MAG: hypothetical protein V7765_06165 [Oleispira sp.]